MARTLVSQLAQIETAAHHPATVCLFGDSITKLNGSCATPAAPALSNSNVESDGFWTWADMYLGGRLTATSNLGIGGQTTTQMLARAGPAILTLSPLPGWCLVNGFANDASNGISPATTIANLSAICNLLSAAGIGVILTTALPHTGSATTQGQVNRGLKAYAAAHPDVILVDWYPYIADPATGVYATVGGVATSDDGIHPNVYGASLMGAAVYQALQGCIPPLPPLTVASNVDAEEKLTNGMFTGTGGALGASTGTIATGWTSRYGAAGVLSQVARTDNIAGQWQQVALTAGSSTDMYATYASSVNDVLVAEVEFQITAGAAFTDFALALADNTGTNLLAVCNRNAAVTTIGSVLPLFPTSGILRTAPTKIATAGLYCFLKVAGTGTVRFARASVKKVA